MIRIGRIHLALAFENGSAGWNGNEDDAFRHSLSMSAKRSNRYYRQAMFRFCVGMFEGGGAGGLYYT